MGMNIEEILEQLDDMLDTAWAMPLSGGKVVVDGDRVRDLLDAIRAGLPSEIRQARAIVKDRADIVDTAKKEAESIIRNAEERRNQILSHEEIVVQAQEKANQMVSEEAVYQEAKRQCQEMLLQTQIRMAELRKASNDYMDDALMRTEEVIAQSLAEVRDTRAKFKALSDAQEKKSGVSNITTEL